MPVEKENHIRTNHDGSKNHYYCVFCFKDGRFSDTMDLDEFIENSLQFASEISMSEDEMRQYFKKTLPTLKR